MPGCEFPEDNKSMTDAAESFTEKESRYFQNVDKVLPEFHPVNNDPLINYEQGVVKSLRLLTALLNINGKSKVRVMPNKSQNVSLIVGRPFTEQEHVLIIIRAKKLEIKNVSKNPKPSESEKVMLRAYETTIPKNYVGHIRVPTLSCIQKTLYKHIEDFLVNTDNYEVEGLMKLQKNNVSIDQSQNNATGRSNKIEEFENKVLRFILTHNVQIQMPETVFDGTTLEISPRKFEGSGLIAKLKFIPKTVSKELGRPRIFFKKIKKFIGEKLLNALLAIVLVVALLLIKFLFFMPLIMGVAAAKKLLLKLLLFFFPFLSHLFKLCPYVQDAHGLTKFHHHHHQIAHLHHVPPYIKHHEHVGHDQHHHHPDYDVAVEYYGGGPDLSADFLHRKTDPPRTVVGDQNEIHSWAMHGKNGNKKPQVNRPLTPAEIEALALKAEKEAVLKVRLQQEHNRVSAENKLLQEKLQQSLKFHEHLKNQMAQVQINQKRPDVRQSAPNIVQGVVPSAHPNHALVPPSESPPPVFQRQIVPTHDPFYSPILEKIDKILVNIGFTEEPCKERIICSMYKNPTKFSPHSNLVSAQLSRDSSELQKPTSTNTAVIRFYRYVQAARDGQDKRECLRLYPACSINTEL
ncbi:hypothetical protein RN001_011993 [Aquatica leii]|uniref:Uncharacterized protein n=1 Tax=Aquatica leii TaxID=1421715 RepID=A0AAN7P6P7_9COLE|nr:hypothetical protein RN001_011993 [Aquatica leii]